MFSLLCYSLTGMSPFQGPTPEDTFLYIMAGELNFSAPVWDKISVQAKDWIQKVLVKQTVDRMNIRKALGHPWLNVRQQPGGLSNELMLEYSASPRGKKRTYISVIIQYGFKVMILSI